MYVCFSQQSLPNSSMNHMEKDIITPITVTYKYFLTYSHLHHFRFCLLLITKMPSSKITYFQSYFEQLPNELFFEIFDYLDAYEIYQSFFKLNRRFQHLFYSSNLPLKVNFLSIFDNQYENDYFNVLNQQKHHITSLNFMYINRIQRIIINSSFTRLKSLVFIDLSTDNLLEQLTNLTLLPYLSSLKILRHHDYSIVLDEIYQRIFQISTLTYFKLSSNIYRPRISFSTDFLWNSIQYLTMNHSCYLDDLYAILSYTPRLIRLTCQELLKPTNTISNYCQIMNLDCLTMISISECYVCFDNFEEFLRKISTHLQTIRIHTYWDANYLDACRWENLIEEYMIEFKEFIFQHHDFLDDDFQLTEYHLLLNQFRSSFWINKKHYFDLTIDVNDRSWTEIIYSLRPSNEISNDLELTLTGSINRDFFIENIFMILIQLPITQLVVSHSEISIEIFTDFIDYYLPYLKVVTINR
mgnify:FL=1